MISIYNLICMKNYSYSELFHKITHTNQSQEDDLFTRFSIYDDERNCLITGDVLRVSITRGTYRKITC